MERFIDNDPGYLEWLAGHPDGFVINTGRTLGRLPDAAPSGLRDISGAPARGTTFTGDYRHSCTTPAPASRILSEAAPMTAASFGNAA